MLLMLQQFNQLFIFSFCAVTSLNLARWNNPLNPERFDADPSFEDTASKWKHWKRIFANFQCLVNKITKGGKLHLLCN